MGSWRCFFLSTDWLLWLLWFGLYDTPHSKSGFGREIHYHLKKKQRAQVLRCVPLSDHRLLGLNFSQKIKLGSYAFLNFSFSYFFPFFFFFKGREHLSTTRQRHLSTFDNETAIDRNIFAILILLSTFVDANLSLFSLN